MSWLNWTATSSTRSGNPNFTAEAREERRAKLEAERIQKAQKRANRQAFFKAGVSAPPSPVSLSKSVTPDLQSLADETESLPDIFLIAEDIFEEIENNMAEFDVENGQDGASALQDLKSVQCPFDKEDIEYWFTEFELQLTMIDIKAQFTKRLAIQRFLPVEVRHEVKALLKLSKADAGNDIYKRIKTELIEIYGPKPEDAYIRAKNRVMTGTPSQLGKTLMDDICDCVPKLACKCCARQVWGMYRESLPVVVRNHIAEQPFNKDTWKSVFKTSDKVYESNQSAEPRAVSVVHPPVSSSSSPEVAAISLNKKNKNKNGKQNKGNNAQSNTATTNSTPAPAASSTSQQGNKGPRHATARGDSEKLCRIHYKWGTNGNFCSAPWKCPMKDIYKAPQ